MKRSITSIIVLIVALLIPFVPMMLNQTNPKQPPVSSDGFLDLSNWSFEKDGIVSLKGTWEFYFNQFLTHEDFQRGVDAQPVSVAIPSTVKSMNASKPFADSTYYGTMRLVIKLPEYPQTYGIRSDIILTSYKLFINGQLQGEVGKVGTDKQSSVPYYNIINTYYHTDDQNMEIIYHTSDFSAKDNTIASPQIGLASQISRKVQVGMGRDLFLFGMLLIMGFYHFGLYCMRPKDRAPLCFGIFCILFSIRMLLVGERFLPNYLNLGFHFYGHMAYLCVFIGFSALCGFIYYTMDNLLPKWFIRLSTVHGTVFSGLVFFFPYHLLDILLSAYAVIGLLMMGYIIVRLVIGMLKGYPFTSIVLLGFVFLAATLINDLIYQITLANRTSLIPLGVAVFTLTQAYTLSARFSSAFTRAEQLSIENTSILSELKQVNTNLESVVQERTGELQKALEEVDKMSKTDYLTKLPNRRSVFARIDEMIKQKKSFFIAMADIDYFKDINDEFGHVVGDEILVQLSVLLSAAVGENGFVGRWGGEEFLIVLESGHRDTVSRMANKIRQTVEEYFFTDIGRGITITIGLCPYKENTPVNAIISQADKALYKGKAEGRNLCIFAE